MSLIVKLHSDSARSAVLESCEAPARLELIIRCESLDGRPLAPWRTHLSHLLPEVPESEFPGREFHTPPHDAWTNAILRRLSRESIHTAPRVHALAKAFLADLSHRARRAGCRAPVLLCVHDAARLDRMSVRFLHRLLSLATALPLEVELHFSSFEVGSPHPSDRFMSAARATFEAARRSIFTRIVGDFGAENRHLLESVTFCAASDSNLATRKRLETAVVSHEFDFAAAVAEQLLAQPLDQNARADVLRLLAIVDANLGRTSNALELLELSKKETCDPANKARFCYLMGLLLAKREGALDRALASMEEGLVLLAKAEVPAETRAVEQAWLLNGHSLTLALLSKRQARPTRELTRRRILKQLLEALALVGREPAPALVYLRHNLLANFAFMLEIMGDHDRAIAFWDASFGPYVAATGRADVLLTQKYRVGLNHSQAGRGAEAVQCLEASLDAARAVGNPFLVEHVLKALASVQERNGELESALATLEELESHQVELGLRARALVTAAAQRAIATKQEKDPVVLPRPNPKLPSSLPEVDLETEGRFNVNQSLVRKETLLNEAAS
jgi:tetratricopeptide (TPR) repeat protein